MTTWTDWTPDVDLTGRTVRVLDGDGAVYVAGRATLPAPVPHPTDQLISGVEMVASPDVPGLPPEARARSAHMRAATEQHAIGGCDCTMPHEAGAGACGMWPTWSLQYLETEA